MEKAEGEEEMRQIMHDLQREEMEELNDKEHFLDNLDARFVDQQKEQAHDRILKEQRRIDKQAAALVVRALETGVPLDGDPVYDGLLKEYPKY